MEFFSRLWNLYQAKFYLRTGNIRGKAWLSRQLLKLAQLEWDEPVEEPTNILDREWDNLIILDACRHDVYEEVRGKEVESIVSVGSHSREFVKNTFCRDTDREIVYVTGNPHIREGKFEELTGKTLDEAFHTVFKTYENEWDDEDGMRPEPIAEDALTAEKLFREKDKIIHFMQPHRPFIGSDIDVGVRDAESGKISPEEYRQGYTESLEFVLEHALDLAEKLSGKTVITADHGELMGEKGMFKHPPVLRCDEHLRVPWDEVSSK